MHLTSAKSILDPWPISLLVLMALFLYLLCQPCLCPCFQFLPLFYFPVPGLFYWSSPLPLLSLFHFLVFTSVYLSPYILPPILSCINTLVLNPLTLVWNQLTLSSISAPSVWLEPTQRANTWPLSLYPIGLLYPQSYSKPRVTSALPSFSTWFRIHLDFDPEKTWTLTWRRPRLDNISDSHLVWQALSNQRWGPASISQFLGFTACDPPPPSLNSRCTSANQPSTRQYWTVWTALASDPIVPALNKVPNWLEVSRVFQYVPVLPVWGRYPAPMAYSCR